MLLICPLRLFAAAHAHTFIPAHLTDLDNFDEQKREDETGVDRGDWSESVHQTQTLEGLPTVA